MSFKEKIEAIRNIELSLLKKESMIGLFFWFSWILAPYMVTEKNLFVKFKIHKKKSGLWKQFRFSNLKDILFCSHFQLPIWNLNLNFSYYS